jgi:hypothetical protein
VVVVLMRQAEDVFAIDEIARRERGRSAASDRQKFDTFFFRPL